MAKKKPTPNQQPSLFDDVLPGVHCVTPNYAEEFRAHVTGTPSPERTAPPAVLDTALVQPVSPEPIALVPALPAPRPNPGIEALLGVLAPPTPKDAEITPLEADSAEAYRASVREFARGLPITIKRPDKTIHRDLEHGWLMPLLVEMETQLWGRWEYWIQLQLDGKLTAEQGPIPRIEFGDGRNAQVSKMVEASLDAISNHGWRGAWSSSGHFDYFLDWLLFSLGHVDQKTLPKEPHGCEGASDRLYQVFNLDAMLIYPADYLGELMAESGFGRSLAFYPTPLSISNLMAETTFAGVQGDTREMSTCDPCVGTGRMLLAASNYSLSLYGIDLNPLCVKSTIINGALYAPWLYRPFPFLDRGRNHKIRQGNSLTDNLSGMEENDG